MPKSASLRQTPARAIAFRAAKLPFFGIVVLMFCLFLVDSNAETTRSPSPHSRHRPNLIVMISVDMLSGEIVDRYAAGLPGGLGRLLREGVVFENAYQEHAYTETCPGHSTLLSGRHPNSTGIGSNEWIETATGNLVYCAGDPTARNIGSASGGAGSSDRNFRGTTLGTWMKDQWPSSRVFAVAGKDRAAIMMAGPKTDGVYWFEDGFGFTTSTAYATELPDWLKEFDSVLMRRLESRTLVWTALGPEDRSVLAGEWKADLTGRLIVSRLPRVIHTQGFPLDSRGGYLLHETQDGSFWRRFGASPFWDEAIFNAAKALVKNEHLGGGKYPDLLCLGLSSTNAIEHAFGNAGPEMQDDVRRLDKELGAFLDDLEHQGQHVVVVLSADHGGLDFAERLRSQGIPARRVDTQAWLHELQGRLKAEFHTNDNLVSGGDQQLYVDAKAAAKLGDVRDVISKIEKVVGNMPEVAAAATREELDALPEKRFIDPRDASIPYRLKFSAPQGRSPDILFAFQPLVERDGPPLHDPAQHGTPWDYDRRVPLIFWGEWKPEHIEKPASTVDIAPTLARELGVTPEEKLDGVALTLEHK